MFNEHHSNAKVGLKIDTDEQDMRELYKWLSNCLRHQGRDTESRTHFLVGAVVIYPFALLARPARRDSEDKGTTTQCVAEKRVLRSESGDEKSDEQVMSR